MLYYSPLVKTTCVRQVVLDKWFPLISSCSKIRVHHTCTEQVLCACLGYLDRSLLCQCVLQLPSLLRKLLMSYGCTAASPAILSCGKLLTLIIRHGHFRYTSPCPMLKSKRMVSETREDTMAHLRWHTYNCLMSGGTTCLKLLGRGPATRGRGPRGVRQTPRGRQRLARPARPAPAGQRGRGRGKVM